MGSEQSNPQSAQNFSEISTIRQFEMVQLLGRGAFAEVVLARKKHSNHYFAIKIMEKKKIKASQQHLINDEIRVLYAVSHPFVIKFYSAFQNSDNLYIVLEFIRGGDLFSSLKKLRHFTEHETKYIAAMLLLALDHLHRRNIIYRDLKPENVMVDEFGYIRLTDFGLSKIFFENQKDDNLFCGTPQYMSPETIQDHKYLFASDYWSFGCLIYEMLCGQSPFQGLTNNQVFKKILTQQPKYDTKYFSKVSIDLLTYLLQKDPNQRLTFQEAITHKFFSGIDFDKLLAKQLTVPYVPPKLLKNFGNISQIFDEEVSDSSELDHYSNFLPNKVAVKDLMGYSGFMMDSSLIEEDDVSDLRSRANSYQPPSQNSSSKHEVIQ